MLLLINMAMVYFLKKSSYRSSLTTLWYICLITWFRLQIDTVRMSIEAMSNLLAPQELLILLGKQEMQSLLACFSSNNATALSVYSQAKLYNPSAAVINCNIHYSSRLGVDGTGMAVVN